MARHIKIAEEELVKLLREKSRQGISILYDNYSSALYGVIHRIVQDDEIAEDVLQECFVKIWANFGQYDATKGRLFTWIINIARNMGIDKVRSKQFINYRKNQSIDSTVSSLDSGHYQTFNPDLIGIREAVRKLEPDYRQIIDLMYFGGYSQSEIAEKLNMPLGTVKTRSRAAIMRLRNLMEYDAQKN